MKNKIAILLMLVLLVCSIGGALADNTEPLSLDGVVIAGETVTVTAPYGCTVEDFSLKEGDMVKSGDLLFPIRANKVYAPCDGTIVGIRTEQGSNAEFVIGKYGALLYIEPEYPFIVEASTRDAYYENSKKAIIPGEKVYLLSTANRDRKGEGIVTHVQGSGYGVEVRGGNIDLNENISVYREETYSSSSKIGSGVLLQTPYVPIQASGSVLSIHVAEGDMVMRGDLLLETVDSALPGGTAYTEGISAMQDGIVTAIYAKPGTFVPANQPVAAIAPAEKLQIAVDVLQDDLSSVAVGSSVDVFVEGDTSGHSVAGKVESISAKGVEKSTGTCFTVYINSEGLDSPRIGMKVVVEFSDTYR